MEISQILQDISSNLNRIVNFYIRDSKTNMHFVNESIKLMDSIKHIISDKNLSILLEKLSALLQSIQNIDKISYLLADDALTYSTLLSIHARKSKF